MPGFVEIKFPQLEAGHQDHCAVVSISADISDLLIDSGHNPDDFNKIVWPIGANVYGRGKFLVTRTTMELLSSVQNQLREIREDGLAGTTNTPLEISFDGLLFDRMYMRTPFPLLPSSVRNKVPEMYVIEMVDERFYWHTHSIVEEYRWPRISLGNPRPGIFKYGLNVLTPTNAEHYEASMLIDDSGEYKLWTLADVMNVMLNMNGTYSDFHGDDEFYFLDQKDWNYEGEPEDYRDTAIQDLHVTGRPFGEFIDKVFTAASHVLIAYPNAGLAPQGKRYRVAPVQADFGPSQFQSFASSEIIYGGLMPSFPFEDRSRTEERNSGIIRPMSRPRLETSISESASETTFATPEETVVAEIPESITVLFPKHSEGGINADTFGGNMNYFNDRWSGITTSAGRTPDFTPGKTMTAYGELSAFWGLHPFIEDRFEWKNEEELKLIAADVSAKYYDRFRSFPLNATLRGTYGNPDYANALLMWSGTQEITWSLTEQGPMTKITGDYNHPLFGYSKSEVLEQSSLQGLGYARVAPKRSGEMMIKAPSFSQAINVGIVTFSRMEDEGEIVDPEDGQTLFYNQPYKVVCLANPDFNITEYIQPMRPHDIESIHMNPLSAGDPVLIIECTEAMAFNTGLPIIEAGTGRSLQQARNSGVTEESFLGDKSLGTRGSSNAGQFYEYFRTESGRLLMIMALELPKYLRCDELTGPGGPPNPLAATQETRSSQTFFNMSNIYGY